MATRYLISDSLQELAIVEFPNGNIEFPKSPVSKVFRSRDVSAGATAATEVAAKF